MTEQNKCWDTTTRMSWWREVNSWSWKPTSTGGWEKVDHCLRCGHSMSGSYGESSPGQGVQSFHDLAEIVARQQFLKPLDDEEAPSKGDDTLLIYCNCNDAHEGRPTEIKSGCGQAAYFRKPTSD